MNGSAEGRGDLVLVGVAAMIVALVWGGLVGNEVFKVFPNWWFIGISAAVIGVPLLVASAKVEISDWSGAARKQMPIWLVIFLRVRRLFVLGFLMGALIQVVQTA